MGGFLSRQGLVSPRKPRFFPVVAPCPHNQPEIGKGEVGPSSNGAVASRCRCRRQKMLHPPRCYENCRAPMGNSARLPTPKGSLPQLKRLTHFRSSSREDFGTAGARKRCVIIPRPTSQFSLRRCWLAPIRKSGQPISICECAKLQFSNESLACRPIKVNSLKILIL